MGPLHIRPLAALGASLYLAFLGLLAIPVWGLIKCIVQLVRIARTGDYTVKEKK